MESLSDRELLDDDTLETVISMKRLHIKRFRTALEQRRPASRLSGRNLKVVDDFEPSGAGLRGVRNTTSTHTVAAPDRVDASVRQQTLLRPPPRIRQSSPLSSAQLVSRTGSHVENIANQDSDPTDL